MKAFIIAGHNLLAPGATAWNGETEHSYTSALQARVIEKANNYIAYTGSSMIPVTDYELSSLSTVVERINKKAKKNDIGCDIHFNFDFPASGTEIFIHPYTNDENKRRAIFIVNEISNVLGIPLRRRVPGRDYKYPIESYRKTLAMINRTIIPFTLPEICFMNQSDLEKYGKKKNEIAHILKLACFHYAFNKHISTYKPTSLKPIPIRGLKLP